MQKALQDIQNIGAVDFQSTAGSSLSDFKDSLDNIKFHDINNQVCSLVLRMGSCMWYLRYIEVYRVNSQTRIVVFLQDILRFRIFCYLEKGT